jgi:cell division septum initiation protein DivIVA
MDVEFLIERLERYILEESPKLFGVRAVNEDEVRSHLAQIRAAIPDEVTQAREIIRDREAVLKTASEEARRIVDAARAKIEESATEHRLVQEARQKADALVRRAKREATGLRSDANEYVFDSLSQLQAELNRLLRVVENGLQKLESDREQNIQTRQEEA